MTAKELADRLDACDHLVMMDTAPEEDEDMLRTTLSADDHNLIVSALRFYHPHSPD